MRRFKIFTFEKYHDLETWDSGDSKLLEMEMAPFDRSYMTSR